MAKDKIKVFHIKHTKNIDAMDVETKEDILQIKDIEPHFAAEDIFNLKEVATGPLARLRNRHRKRKPIVFYVDGKPHCEKLKTSSELFEPISNEDRKNLVKKEVAKALGKYQAMKPIMFIILMILLVVVIILQILILRGGGHV
jgi:hypothetical protein